MKKTSTVLIVLSFLFALAAVVIALGGTFLLKRQAGTIASEVREDLNELDEEVAAKPELPEGYELNESQDPVPVTPEELGFTFLAPNEWGAFTITYTPGHFKGSGTYRGTFENMEIVFEATDPTFVPGRGGYWGDALGYRETTGGFEANFIGQTWMPISDRLVQGEIAVASGSVLVVSAAVDEGPVPFAGEDGVRFAVANFEAGPIPGGVFRAGPDVTRDEFLEFLESLEFVAAE